MRRIILVLAMLALLATMALPAIAQSSYDDDDYGRGYYDDYDDRGYDDDPRDPQCGWYPSWGDDEEW